MGVSSVSGFRFSLTQYCAAPDRGANESQKPASGGFRPSGRARGRIEIDALAAGRVDARVTNAYTSLFLEPAVARWTLGGDFSDLHAEEDWTLVTKTPVQYNVGHIAVAEGDTVSPDGRYLVFGSNRNNGGGDDTNVFIAEWVN